MSSLSGQTERSSSQLEVVFLTTLFQITIKMPARLAGNDLAAVAKVVLDGADADK